MLIPARAKLLCIGDSITDSGRSRPNGEGLFDGLGKHGWVREVDAHLQAFYPELGIRTVNQGISGNTVRDLASRWQTDVLDHKPQWLAVMIGINDVWRQFDSPWQPEWAVGLEEYRSTLDRLLTQTRPTIQGLVLLTPFYIGTDMADPMRQRMDEYGAVVGALATAHNATFVDTQAALDRVCRHIHPTGIAWDRIHANHIGHMTIARAFLDGIGFTWGQGA